MFLLVKPTDEAIKRFIEDQARRPFTYQGVGSSLGNPPPGYKLDRNRVRLGEGEPVFRKGVEAIRCWKMFEMGWIQICWPDAPIVGGATVGILARHFGFWSLNACRIVRVIDDTQPIRRYGFAYGTLPGHAESGEERFMIEWRSEDDSVWYDILAFSKPRHWLALAGYPVARHLQKRFASESKRAIYRAVNG